MILWSGVRFLGTNDYHVKARNERFTATVSRFHQNLKSGSPEISPGGVQNEKIENPQTLPESRSEWTISRKNTLSSIRFLCYANGGKIGFAALTFALRGPDNPFFERRLKINETENVTIDYLNEKNTYLRTLWNAYCLTFNY